MKINYIGDEELEEIRKQTKNYGKPLKPRKVKLDHKLISKVGKALYGFDQAKEVLIKVRLKGGTAISFYRSEDDDRFDHIKRKIDEREEEDD